MSGITQPGFVLKCHPQGVKPVSSSGSVGRLIVGLLALGCYSAGSFAATQSSPPLEVITLSDKGLLPPEGSGEDKSAAQKSASSLSSSLRAGSASKDLHKDSDGPRADAPFPSKKASMAAPASVSTTSSAGSYSHTSTYVVKKGDTLDKVVQKTLGDSPLKSEILKREIIALNPDAFTKGSQKILKSGVTLTLPSNDDLLRSQLGMAQSSSQQGSHKQFVGYETYPDVIINPQGMEKRKSWVQFP